MSEVPAAVFSQFAQRRRRHLLALATHLLVMVALALVSASRGKAGVIVFLGGLLLSNIGMAAWSAKNWRCPSCGLWFAQRINPRMCPRCRTAMRA